MFLTTLAPTGIPPRRHRRCIVACTALALALSMNGGVSAQPFEITIDAPEVRLLGSLIPLQPVLDSLLDVDNTMSTIAELETQLNSDEDIQRFASLPELATAAAHAGAAAAHLGTQRAFSDYRILAVVVGAGVGVSVPGLDPLAFQTAVADLETEGDIYVGASIQPIVASIGFNLSRWIPKTRVDAKVGLADIAQGTVSTGIAYSSLSVGMNLNYQLLASRQAPLGVLRWRGLTLATGLLFQRSRTDLTVTIQDEDFSQPITYGDLGFSPAALAALGRSADDSFLDLVVSPTITAVVESRTYSIPFEVTTGLRIFWLLDINLGAGVDLVFGRSRLEFGTDVGLDADPDPAFDDAVVIVPGSVAFNITNTASPRLLRPRLTSGIGFNIGPAKLDIPVMLFFEPDGNTVMAGVNLGIVW